MADLRILGPPSLTGPQGHSVPLGPIQTKSVALLAYLVMNSTMRYHTGDALVALLWPRQPDGMGAASLSEAVRWLCAQRQGPVITVNKYDEYSLDPSLVTSDIKAFQGAMRMGRFQDALTYYGGNLMEGVVIPEAPEFMLWLRLQRVKFSRRASAAAWREFRRARRNEELADAKDWALSAYRYSPDPDAILAKTMDHLADIGQEAEGEALLLEQAERRKRKAKPQRSLRPSLGTLACILVAACLAALVFATAVPVWNVVGPESGLWSPRPNAEDKEQVHAPTIPRQNTNPPYVRWLRANWHLTQGHYSKADSLFRELLTDPNFIAAAIPKVLVATSSRRRGDPYPAPLEFANPWVAGNQLAAAALGSLIVGDLSAADEILADLTSQGGPMSPLTTTAEILLAWKRGDPARSYDLVNAARPGIMNLVEGPLGNDQFMAWAAQATGDHRNSHRHARSALEWSEQRIELTPEDPWGYRGMSLAYTTLGLLEQAEDQARKGLRRALAAGDHWAEHKLLEALVLASEPGSLRAEATLAILLSARYPWPLDQDMLDQDPRWNRY